MAGAAVMTELERNRMEEMVRRLNEASEAYYGGRDEIMSNYEWDALFDELIKIMRDNSPELQEPVSKIEKIVNQVVQSKINENQFENVAFTMKDLTVIKKTLISVLQSMYHTRKVKKIEDKKQSERG